MLLAECILGGVNDTADDLPPLDVLERFVRARDHESVDLAFPVPVAQERISLILGIGLACLVPLSLLLVGYPGAAFVEAQGWWHVNEGVMTTRWFLYGPLVAAVLIAGWVLFRPRGARMRVDRHRIAVKRALRRPVTVRTADVVQVELNGDRTTLVLELGRVMLPDLVMSVDERYALYRLLSSHARSQQRDEGDAGDVPRELSRVVEQER